MSTAKRPLPIAFAITELDVGGAERTFVELVTRLDRRRWRPSVTVLQGEAPLVAPLRSAGIPCRCLGILGPQQVPAGLYQWICQLRRERPTLLCTFLFHANLLGRLAGRLAGVRRVLNGIRVAEHRSRARLWLDRWTERWADGQVCVSQAVREYSIRTGGLDPARLQVIGNGVDTARADAARPLDRAARGIRPTATVLLFVGRLEPQKGIADLLAAAEILAARTESLGQRLPDWQLVIVGDGPLRGQVAERARSGLLRQRLVAAGWQPNPLDWMATADLLVLPSRWEGMPNVVLEAMACRRAVVATAVDGTPEVVEPGTTGWLVPPGDPAALAAALIEALADPAECARRAAAGRQWVEQQFTYPQMVAAYERIFRTLLRSSD